MIICIYTANAAAIWSYSALRSSLCEVGLPTVVTINLSLLNGQILHLPPAFRRCCSQPITPHRRGNVGLAAHRCTVELLDRGTDVIGVSGHKEVPGIRLLKRSTETMVMIAIFVRIICWNVSDSRAVLAGRFRHQWGRFVYTMGRFGWYGPFWRWVVFVHSPAVTQHLPTPFRTTDFGKTAADKLIVYFVIGNRYCNETCINLAVLFCLKFLPVYPGICHAVIYAWLVSVVLIAEYAQTDPGVLIIWQQKILRHFNASRLKLSWHNTGVPQCLFSTN